MIAFINLCWHFFMTFYIVLFYTLFFFTVVSLFYYCILSFNIFSYFPLIYFLLCFLLLTIKHLNINILKGEKKILLLFYYKIHLFIYFMSNSLKNIKDYHYIGTFTDVCVFLCVCEFMDGGVAGVCVGLKAG